MKTYDRREVRLDHFWFRLLKQQNLSETGTLGSFLKMVLLLSDGNAELERGFSISKECLVDNLKEESLIAHRRVFI